MHEAIRYWEPRRAVYNIALTAIVIVWVARTWPHFRDALTLSSLKLVVLGLLANVCYSAAYLVDIPLRRWSSASGWWQRGRLGLWTAGTLFASLLTNYWIGDEIYPFVH
ncbi:MAG TPA: hypothetical protein VJX69_02335 [Terriglobales bacterium]|nr:hypothetical protein [Terriglobales bacterium]